MHNLEVIYRCEDKQDAKKLQTWAACLQGSSTLTNSPKNNDIDDISVSFSWCSYMWEKKSEKGYWN